MGTGQTYPQNYRYNATACSFAGCGQIEPVPGYAPVDADVIASYLGKVPRSGNLSVPGQGSRIYTFQKNPDSGGLVTLQAQGTTSPSHVAFGVRVSPTPVTGNWPSPSPPPVVLEQTISKWSDPATWDGTLDHPANPLNTLQVDTVSEDVFTYTVIAAQNWSGPVPGVGDDVWIPPWKRVSLILGDFMFWRASSIPLGRTQMEPCVRKCGASLFPFFNTRARMCVILC